jgi:hypothetical protein
VPADTPGIRPKGRGRPLEAAPSGSAARRSEHRGILVDATIVMVERIVRTLEERGAA